MSNDPKFTADDLDKLRELTVTLHRSNGFKDLLGRVIAHIEPDVKPDLPPVGWVKYTTVAGNTYAGWHRGDGKFADIPEGDLPFTLSPAELATAVPLVEPVVVDKAALDKAYGVWAEHYSDSGNDYRTCLAAAFRTIDGVTVVE